MSAYVIFAIDNDDDLHTNAKFMRHMDEARAMGKLKGNCVLCIGSYNDVLERSYLVSAYDFVNVVADSGYLDNQESILSLETGYKGRTYATLRYRKDDADPISLGEFRSISPYEIGEHRSWTYRPDLGIYFVADGGQ